MIFRKRYYVYIIGHKRIVQVDTGQIREHNHLLMSHLNSE